MFYRLKPEVAGEWGESTIANTSIHPPEVLKLEYRFEGWLGDDLLEVFPCFIVTERLKTLLCESDLTGFIFDDVIISYSDTFMELYPQRVMPKFFWLKVSSKKVNNDLFISEDLYLIASQNALDVLKKYQLDICQIDEYHP